MKMHVFLFNDLFHPFYFNRFEFYFKNLRNRFLCPKFLKKIIYLNLQLDYFKETTAREKEKSLDKKVLAESSHGRNVNMFNAFFMLVLVKIK